jgi:hypothetical protein
MILKSRNHTLFGSTFNTRLQLSHVILKINIILEFLKDKKFFRLILHDVLNQCLNSNIQVVELRHSFGNLVNENQESVPLEEELKIIENTISHI